MLLDADDLEPGSARACDVCVAGAGAAGITIARELSRLGLTVCLLEGGGLELEEASQNLYDGVSEPPVSSDYATISRLRFLGGTTNHWLGFCRPLETWDFEARPWIPHSGWPMSRRDLDSYYERAAAVLEIPTRLPDDRPLGDDTSNLFLGCFHRNSLRFGNRYLEELRSDRRIELLTHASAVHVAMAESGRAVRRLEAVTPGGRRLLIEARRFVLALGAIENARVLLLSDDVMAAGVGNQRDLVGRFFTDHAVLSKVARCATRDTTGPLHARPEGADYQACFLDRAGQEAHGIGGCALAVDLLPAPEPPGVGGLRSIATPVLDRVLEERDMPRVVAERPYVGLRVRVFDARPEAVPNPESRVLLDPETDATGRRKVRLRLRQDSLERLTAARSLELLATAFGRHALGRLWIDPRPSERRMALGFHAAGTTRMHADPSRGVVDGDCRVHGVDNLFVAGGSVFPTAGAVNPTFTIVALALRLADHLASEP